LKGLFLARLPLLVSLSMAVAVLAWTASADLRERRQRRQQGDRHDRRERPDRHDRRREE
jgi:hypothetical protein